MFMSDLLTYLRYRCGKIAVMTLPLPLLFITTLTQAYSVAAGGPKLIELTQTPCIIIEAEESPVEYISSSKADCEKINKKTGGDRAFRELRLKPGKTVFRVTNRNVPYDLGFWVRGKGIGRLTLPSVSGGGLKTGETIEYEIDLKEGEYLYSCPLNSTPDYPLIVEK